MGSEVPASAEPFVRPKQEMTGGGVDVREYVDLLRRRWIWVLAAGLLAFGAVLLYEWQRVRYPVYTAEALVQRLPQNPGLAGLALPGASRPSEEIASELEILRTTQVLGPVVDSAGLRLVLPATPTLRSALFDHVDISAEAAAREYHLVPREGRLVLLAGAVEVATMNPGGIISGPGFVFGVTDPLLVVEGGIPLEILSRREAIEQLDESLRTDQVTGTNLIRIRYTSLDPALSANVANALARAYQRQAAERARVEARRRREFLAGRLESVSDSLREAQEVLLEFQARSSTVNPQSEGQTLSGLLLDAQEELRRLQEKERMVAGLLDNLERGGREGLRQMMILSGELNTGAQELQRRLQQYEERRSTLTSVNRRAETSPDVQLLDSLIAETKAEMRLTVAQSLRLVRQDRAAAAARVAELQRELGSVPERNVAFSRLQQRVDAIQGMHDMLAARFYEAQIAEAVEAGDVQIVDPAVVPTDPSGSTGRQIPPLLALMAGMFLGFCGVVGYEKLDSRIRTAEEVRRFSGTEIVGRIPALVDDRGNTRPLVALHGTTAAEAFRMLRTNLRFARAEQVRVLMVTSPGPAEGKSVVSSNLAVTMAQEGRKVLLIDADLRRPIQHRVFGVERGPGLSDVLVGDADPTVIRPTESGIDLCPAGSSVPSSAELVGSQAFQRVLEWAKEHYDTVVIDTPPLLTLSDASIIVPSTDGVLLVARQERTHRGALLGAAEQLRRSRATILGVVVNDTSPHGGRYGYGYGYGYGGYYYGYGAEDYLPEARSNGSARKRGRFKIPFVGKS